MAKLVSKKIQASSLVEVLVAMIIILTVFVIATKIYFSAFVQTPSPTKLNVNSQLSNQLAAIQTGNTSVPDSLVIDSITYHFTTSPFPQNDSLHIIQITATQQQKIVGKIKGIVPKNTDDEED